MYISRARRRKKLRRKNRRIIYVICLLIVLFCGFKAYKHRRQIRRWFRTELGIGGSHSGGGSSTAFNDLQATQLKAAKKNGITPLGSKKAIQKLVDKGKLVEVESCNGYKIDYLSASYPYLVPKAKKLLDDIAAKVQAETGSKSRFIVTSVLRTEQSQKKLRGSNGNATSHSCHMYGTTVDITYARYDLKGSTTDKQFGQALGKALKQLRDNGRCYIVREANQKCYHLTVR